LPARCPLSRGFSPLRRNPDARATTPGPSRPGSSYVLPLTMRFDVLLPKRPPWCLSTRRVHGVRFPSELAQTEITAASRPRYPLLRLADGWITRLFDPKVDSATCLPGPRHIHAALAAGLCRYASGRAVLSHVATFGSGSSTGCPRSPRDFVNDESRPRFRGLSLPLVGSRRKVSPRFKDLALLGFSLPEAFPFPGLGLSAS